MHAIPYCLKSNNARLVVFTCPSTVLSLAVDCVHFARLLLLLAGDVEKTPWLSQDLLKQIARDIKEIKKD